MDRSTLIQTAIDALKHSYVPYSHFHVAAALLCRDGSVYTGVNIENASYTPTVCAERVAIFKAVSEGKREFDAIAVCGGLHGRITDYCPPCGVCRQVMQEFCDPDTFQILIARSAADYKVYTLKELLPLGFGSAVLEETQEQKDRIQEGRTAP